MIDLDEMARLNEARTQGPWHVNGQDVWDEAPGSMTYGIPLLRAERGNYRSWGRALSDDERDANAAFIAFLANHADEILARLKRAGEMEKALERIAAIAPIDGNLHPSPRQIARAALRPQDEAKQEGE